MKITLYKRARKSDKIQVWTIAAEDGSFWTTQGQLGGAMTISAPTVAKPKNKGRANATTAEEQAVLQAESKIAKKIKEGYYYDIKDIDQGLSHFEPMLAKKYFERYPKHVVFPVFVQCKFNGYRCIATKDGLFSRKGERYLTAPHIEASLAKFFDENPEAILDGELFNEDYREKLNELSKILRPTVNITPELLERSEEIVRFYVYDGFGFTYRWGDTIVPVEQSDEYITRASGVDANLRKNPYYKKVKTLKAHDHEGVMKIYNDLLQDRHEGAIVRLLNKPYESGRSAYLLKVKPTDDGEFKILSVNEGEGNRAGVAATVTCLWPDGRTFNANIMGTQAQRLYMLQNPHEFVGKMATIYYNGLTGLGLPNYAQFNPDNSIASALDK
jgi:DNA ligase-1